MKVSLTAKLIFVIGVFTLVLTNISCSDYKVRAEGVQNEVLVFITEEDLPKISPIIDSLFSDKIYTPQPEYLFEVRYMTPDQFEDRKLSHNIIVVSLFNSEDKSSYDLVRKLLSKSQLEMAKNGDNQIFVTRDFFARGQVFTILASHSIEKLTNDIKERKDWLYEKFDSAFLEREKEYIYKTMEQKKLSKELAEKYGWRMRIQHDYMIIREDDMNNFVWLGRAFPNRWISIHWIDDASDTILNKKYALALNQRYPIQFYPDISFTKNYLRAEKTTFNEWKAWKIQGLWQHDKKQTGGPFISYIFFDESTNRIYHINLLIQYPGYPKVVFLRQLDIIAHTFTTLN